MYSGRIQVCMVITYLLCGIWKDATYSAGIHYVFSNYKDKMVLTLHVYVSL